MLQQLTEYYNRCKANPQTALPMRGFEKKPIPVLIVLNPDGCFNCLQDTRMPNTKENKLSAKSFLIPQSKIRSGAKSYETVNILWDHYGYVLNQPKIEKAGVEPTAKATIDADKQHQSFKKQINILAIDLPDDIGVQTVKKFLDNPDEIIKAKQDPLYQDFLKIKGCNVVFKLAGETSLCCQSPQVQKWVKKQLADIKESVRGICLASGESTTIARLHPPIQKILGKPSPLSSINNTAFESYGSEKGFNFPVSEASAFEYTTALNYLLSSDQSFRVGDVTVACWAQNQHKLEYNFATFFGSQDDPSSGIDKVKSLFRSFNSGAKTNSDDQQPFYILGLAPNAPARIVVRFWIADTIANISNTIKQWFEGIELVGNDKFGYPSLIRLLRCTVFQGKDKNIPPKLAAEVANAIMRDLPLPTSLLANCLERIRSEQGKASYTRCCLIKAYLNKKSTKGNITVSLDPEQTQIGYVLGRLFAALEKLQQDAFSEQKLNTTICDNYYSSASCRPKAVFPALMKLHINHIKKLDKPSYKISAKNRIGEIIKYIDNKQGFPAQLDLEQQGLFAIGYYHQQQNFYTKKED